MSNSQMMNHVLALPDDITTTLHVFSFSILNRAHRGVEKQREFAEASKLNHQIKLIKIHSSLLNVLSGFIKDGVSGDVKINGRDVVETNFHKRCTYIMQEENLYGILTLKETMNFAFKFKTGTYYTKDEQRVKVKSILETLRLDDQRETFVKNLSGGQKKRLAIALELVDDPPVLFLVSFILT